jgi:hypothetical protein
VIELEGQVLGQVVTLARTVHVPLAAALQQNHDELVA